MSEIINFENMLKEMPAMPLFSIADCGHGLPIEKPLQLANIVLSLPFVRQRQGQAALATA